MNTVTKTIFLPLLVSLAITAPLSAAQAEDIPVRGPIPFATYDMNGDGSVSESEFNTIRAKRIKMRAIEGRPMKGMANAPKFTDFDLNSDGKLSTDELAQGQSNRAQKRPQKGTGMGSGMGNRMGLGSGKGRRMAGQNFQSFDVNKDGCINAEEFAQVQANRQGANPNRNMPVFSDFDGNNDGYINEQELEDGRAERIRERVSQGYKMKNLPYAPTFAEIDTNKDGKIDQNEFAAQQAQHRMQGPK